MTKAIDANVKGEWSRELNVEFIGDYKKLKVIWDPSMRHLKSDRVQAVRSLCEKYKLSPDDVRGRIKVLRTSFHREHIKVLKSTNSHEVYVPRWYGYDLMKFIVNDIEKDQSKVKSEADDSLHISDATIFDTNFFNFQQLKNNEINKKNNGESISEEDELPNSTELNTNEGVRKTIFKTPGKCDKTENFNKKIEEKPEEITVKCDNILFTSKDSSIELSNENLDSSINNNMQSDADSYIERHLPCKRTKLCMPNVCEKNFTHRLCCHCHCNQKDKDEHFVFGENVAFTLKSLKNDKSKIIAKHMINNILFEAQMGKYDQ